MFLLYVPWKYQKNFGFLGFSGGIKSKHWQETSSYAFINWNDLNIVRSFFIDF